MAQLSLLTRGKDIAAAQKRLRDRIAAEATPARERTIGFPSGSLVAPVRYLPHFDLWHATQKLDNRWWNGFGFGNPDDNRANLTLTAEINPSCTGSLTCAGAFFHDGAGNLFLGHSGKVGGGRKGVGKIKYVETVRSKIVLVDGNEYIGIGRIEGKPFLRELAVFVRSVEAFKASVANTSVTELELDPIDRARKYGPGGESHRHKQLKLRIAQDPTLLGLGDHRVVRVEYRFITSNRADLMVQLADHSYAVVEVELEGSVNTMVGAHQALAYRALMAAELNAPDELIHAVLVAHEIPAKTRAFCRRHDVHAVVVVEG
jgi:hypothetical protein